MITDNFKLDFEKQKILYIGDKSTKTYQIKELYSYIQDVFDEPENMRYDIPIEAKGKNKFRLINGWSIDEKAKKHLKGDLVV